MKPLKLLFFISLLMIFLFSFEVKVLENQTLSANTLSLQFSDIPTEIQLLLVDDKGRVLRKILPTDLLYNQSQNILEITENEVRSWPAGFNYLVLRTINEDFHFPVFIDN